MALKIITDSASDLPKELAQKYQIQVIPTPVVIEGTDYFDGETIQPEEFYQLLRDGKEIKTYHINSYMFSEAFRPYAKRGDQLIYVCFSTGIAGTFNAANLAKTELLEEYPKFDLTIIDSRCASIGFGLVVYFAAQLLLEGADKDTLVEKITYWCSHMKHILTVDTLEYLYKGGRLTKTSFAAGSILNIKPVIKVDEKGALVAIEKIRGRKRSLERIVDIVGEWGEDLENQTVGVVHGDDRESLDHVKQMLTEKYGITKFVENYVGCAIGAHTGPGIIGITFLGSRS